jgi:type IV pilus assembly protein PilF
MNRVFWLMKGLCAVIALSACNTNPVRNETHPGAETPAQINLKLGVEYMRRGIYDLALTKLQRALEYDPKLPDAHNAIAILYSQLGETQLADEHYQRALYLAPNDSKSLNNYGAFLCDQGRYEEADKYFLRAINNPLYAARGQAYENVALCALRIPDLDKAEEYMRKALEINPTLPKSLYQMANLSFDKGGYLSARAYLQRYLEVASHTPDSLWLCVRVERELGDRSAEASCALVLERKYPDSREARLLQGLEAQ